MKLYLTVFCLMNLITGVKSVRFDIKPSTNIQAGTPTLTVRCQPTTVENVTSVDQIEIYRRRESVKYIEENFGNIEAGKEAELGPGLTSPKYTVSGSLTSNISTSFLQIVIQDPNSNDTGIYRCQFIGGNSNEFSYISSSSLDVIVQDPVDEGVINSDPRGEAVINLGSVLFVISTSFVSCIPCYL